MASIIPDYKYDIFISYRQKDNKGDHWVSEFVDALRIELESTFKEEISVYFDINPHDGLLETHDVDASLEEKLRCLVFIPVISRTYCDPKSFAWEKEFLPFVEMASKDQYGLKVKLPSGNVAGRVLPVQIHEIDADDKKLVEDVLGGRFRGIEFIYREPGVNRPLTLKDNEDKNSCRTSYRNQVNKVANAINEIISGMKGIQISPVTVAAERNSHGRTKPLNKVITAVIILAGLILAGIIFFPRLTGHSKEIETSIAVLPIKNDSPDKSNDYIVNGVFEEIINNLQKIKSFSRVLPRISVEKYRSLSSTPREIAEELNVNYILSGSAQVIDNTLRLNINLYNAREDRSMKAFTPVTMKIAPQEIYRLYGEIAQSVADELNAGITPGERKIIEQPSTMSISAYSSFQKGSEELSNYSYVSAQPVSLLRAEALFRTAISDDPGFADAYTGLAGVLLSKQDYAEYANNRVMDSVLLLLEKAVSINNNSDLAHAYLGAYYEKKGIKEKALKEYDKALEINPNSWMAYTNKGYFYLWIDNFKCIQNLQAAASLNHGKEYYGILRALNWAYASAGCIDEANHINSELLKSGSDSSYYLLWAGAYEKDKGNYNESIRLLNRSYQLNPQFKEKSYYLLQFLGDNYLYLGQLQNSLLYHEKYLRKSDSAGLTNDARNKLYIEFIRKKAGVGKDSVSFYRNVKAMLDSLNIKVDYSDPKFDFTSMYEVAALNAALGDKDIAYRILEMCNGVRSIPLWMVTRLKDDPMFAQLRNEDRFKRIFRDVETKYNNEHKLIAEWLEKNKIQ